MRGHTRLLWRLLAMSPPSTSTVPCCTARAPATSASRLDLPTPSGPIRPTMRPEATSRSMPSSARGAGRRRAGGPRVPRCRGGSLVGLDGEVGGPLHGRVYPQPGHAGQAGLDLLLVAQQQRLVDLRAHAEHELLPLAGGLYRLGGELRGAGDKP